MFRAAALFAALLTLPVFAFACGRERLENTVVFVEMPTPRITEEPTPEPTAVPSEEPTAEPTPELEDVSATMMFVGDLMCLSMQQHGGMSQSDGTYQYDFRPSFEYVRHILNKADFAIGNLETALSPSAPYSTQLRNFDDGMPNLNAPPLYLMAVKYAGFDALVLANNHCCDAGATGIEETIAAVEEYGFPHTGIFRTESDKRYVMLDVKGIKIALMSYSEFFNSQDKRLQGRTYMINRYSEEALKRDVAAARAEGAELIIAYNHWGAEHTHEPTEKVRLHAQQMADAGVDVICGSHSHAVQPVVWLEASDGRRVLCMYSLGNFVSSMGRSTANDTFIAEIEIKREGGRVSVVDEKYHPARVFPKLENKHYVVVPTEGDWVSSVRSELNEAHERIMAIVLKGR